MDNVVVLRYAHTRISSMRISKIADLPVEKNTVFEMIVLGIRANLYWPAAKDLLISVGGVKSIISMPKNKTWKNVDLTKPLQVLIKGQQLQIA